jgi:hypothetical protein
MSTGLPSSSPANNASRRGRPASAHHPRITSRRTTITLTAEAQEIVERVKSASGKSTSAAINQIIQRAEPKPSRLKNVNGFLVLDQPLRRVKVTLEDVKSAEDQLDREMVERMMVRKPGQTAKGKTARQRQ